MADTSAQMATLKIMTEEQASKRGHYLAPYEEYSGGAVNIALCQACKRHAWVEIFPFGEDTRGPALTADCGTRKVE